MPLNQKERECAINLDTLPDDVLVAILRYCDRRSLCVLSRVSKNLYRVARDDSIWRGIALRCVNVHPSDRKCGFNWKELCRVSWNWTHGYCKDRSVIKFKCNLMPWIQLGRPRQLFVAQAADVILYQKNKRSKSQSTWQPLVTFCDHQGDVSKFVIVEGQLVTCSTDKSIRTWSLTTGLCDGLYLGHSSDVHSVDCFGGVIVTGSQDKTVKVWSQQSKSCVHTIHVQDNVWTVSLNPSLRSVVSGSSGHTRDVSPLQLWDIDSGRLTSNLVSGAIRPGAGVRGIKWETPYTLLSCGYDTNVRLWDTRLCDHSGSSCVLKWEDPHDSVVYCVDSDRKWMVISGTNRYGVVRIWDKRFRKCLQLQLIAKERDERRRANFRRYMAQFSKHELLFVDESSKDDRTFQRKYAQGLKGMRVSRKGNFTRGTRYSVLGAIAVDDVKAAHAIESAYNKQQFEYAMEHFVLPHVGSYANKERCSVIVMDNCRIHHSQRVFELVRQKGGMTVFLPPYSPDMNPIELCFGSGKSWLQRHQDVCDKYPKRCFEIALHEVSSDSCAEFFASCGYM